MTPYLLSRTQLNNGLKVLHTQVKNTAGFEIALHIDTGSRDETPETNGISHFLEHMMFRGTERFPTSIDLACALEECGGEANAMTTNESTVYWLKGAAAKMDTAIDVFGDFALNTNYANLETERSIILQELAGDYNENGDNIDIETLGMQALFQDHPLGFPIIGTEENLKRIGTAELIAKKNLFYRPSNCILTIVSPQSLEDILPNLNRAFNDHWPVANLNAAQRDLLNLADFFDRTKNRNGMMLQNNADNQFNLKIICPATGGNHRDVVVQTFLQRILDDGISSRLPGTLREKHGLVYDISCESAAYYDIGTFTIDATVSTDMFDTLLMRLTEELRIIQLQGPSVAEMNRVRFRYSYDLKMIVESPFRYLSREVSNLFCGGDMSVDAELQMLESVTADEVVAMARKCLQAARRGIALVGPKARKRRDSMEQLLQRLKV